MKPQSKFVVSTDLIKVIDNGVELVIHIKLSQGGWLEHEPMPRTLEGLVSALMLSADVNAGKFFPRRYIPTSSPEVRKLVDATALKGDEQ